MAVTVRGRERLLRGRDGVPRPLLAGGARTPCSDSVQLAVPDQLSRVLTGGPGCEHEHSPYLILSHVW